MEFFSQTYTALRGPTGLPQTPSDAIPKLVDRLSQSTMLPDRRAAVLALKGLARDHKAQVGDAAMPGLIEVLLNDSDVDIDIAKAVLECLTMLCSTADGEATSPKTPSHLPKNDVGIVHTDYLLANPVGAHKLFELLSSTSPENFYTPFCTLQLLGVLLSNRKQVVQKYFISSPQNCGTTGVLNALSDKREILRNEALGVLQQLISSNVEIQKILAFSGAFDSLLTLISAEGGVEGGVVVQDSFNVLDLLLRLNVSNQTYFRETHLPALLSLLLFPSTLTLESEYATPQEFALQFWNPSKATTVQTIVGLLSLFARGKDGQEDALVSAVQRCLVEMALASNAPSVVKAQAIQAIPSNPSSALATLVLTPYAPVPGSNGEEWDRLEHTSALSALVDLILDGEYGLEGRSIHDMALRGAAASVFENFVRRTDVREAVMSGMGVSPDAHPPRASLHILTSLTSPPPQPLDIAFSFRTHLSSTLFGSLVLSSHEGKTVARGINLGGKALADAGSHKRGESTGFWVPADTAAGSVPPPPKAEETKDEDEEDISLMSILTEYMSLAFLLRLKMDGTGVGEEREWDRLLIGYLTLFIKWLWDDPTSVGIFLDARGLDALVEPINQPHGIDPLVKGLSAFLLGVCYEFCPEREEGPVSRSSIHQIITRLGSELIIGTVSRVRSDTRFRDLTPEALVTPCPGPSGQMLGELWFDWSFVEFWKTNFYTVQRCLSLDPETLARSKQGGASSENAALVASLREKLSSKTAEVEQLQKQVSTHDEQRDALQDTISQLSTQLASAHEKQKEAEQEHEDLLVLLDEMSSKRKRDKIRLRELGDEVSEDEEDGGEEDEGVE